MVDAGVNLDRKRSHVVALSAVFEVVLSPPIGNAQLEPPWDSTLLANSSLVVGVTSSGSSGCRWTDGHGARRSAMSLRPDGFIGDPR
jgi:hypothetical protein